MFVVYHGRNNKGCYVLVIEFFDNGRRSFIIVPEGQSFAGWNHFGKALSDLLVVSRSKGVTFHHRQPSFQTQRRTVGGLSFADVLKKGVAKEKQSLRINVTPNRKRVVRWTP